MGGPWKAGPLAPFVRMVRNLEGVDRIEPTPEEEAALQRVFSQLAAQSIGASAVAWAAAAGNPTDVREADLTIALDPAAAHAIGRAAFDAERAEFLEDGEDLLRGWWLMGGALNGNPVVVTLAFAADGLGGTRVTVRSAVKFYLTNQDLAQEALDRMQAALDLDAREHVTS